MPRDKKTKGSFPSFLCCFPSFESVPSFLPSEPSTFQQFRRRRRNCIPPPPSPPCSLDDPLHPPLLHHGSRAPAPSELKVNAEARRATGRGAGAPPTRPRVPGPVLSCGSVFVGEGCIGARGVYTAVSASSRTSLDGVSVFGVHLVFWIVSARGGHFTVSSSSEDSFIQSEVSTKVRLIGRCDCETF